MLLTMLNVNQLTGFGSGSGGGVVLEFLGSDSTSSSPSGTSYTFSTKSLGTASSDRQILVVAAITGTNGLSDTDPDISSITVAGETAPSLESADDGSTNTVYIRTGIASVPSGTTGDIVVNLASSFATCCGIAWYKVTNTDNTVDYASDEDTDGTPGDGTTPVNIDLASTGGFIVVGAVGRASSNLLGNWAGHAGLSQDAHIDMDGTNNQLSVASIYPASSGTYNLSCAYNSGENTAANGIAFK